MSSIIWIVCFDLPVKTCSFFSSGSFTLRAAALGSILGKSIIIIEKAIQIIPMGVQPVKENPTLILRSLCNIWSRKCLEKFVSTLFLYSRIEINNYYIFPNFCKFFEILLYTTPGVSFNIRPLLFQKIFTFLKIYFLYGFNLLRNNV